MRAGTRQPPWPKGPETQRVAARRTKLVDQGQMSSESTLGGEALEEAKEQVLSVKQARDGVVEGPDHSLLRGLSILDERHRGLRIPNPLERMHVRMLPGRLSAHIRVGFSDIFFVNLNAHQSVR